MNLFLLIIITLNIRSAIAINKQNNYNNNNNKNNNNKKNVKTNSNIYELRKKLNWCGPKHEKDALVGLDDRLCQKQFPKLFNRDFQCPSFKHIDRRTVKNMIEPSFYPPSTNISNIIINETELNHILFSSNNNIDTTTNDFSIAIGIIQRDPSNYDSYKIRYIGKNATDPHETWSSSKIYAGHNAGHKVNLSMYEIGKETNVTLSDLMTIVTSYDTTKKLTSNGIGAYYHSIGGHKHANQFIHEILGASSMETFGGNYGEPVPSPPLEYTFTNTLYNPYHHHQIIQKIIPDPTPIPPLSNTMSSITMAEWLRRIIFSREDKNQINNEYFEWENSKNILYGAINSTYFPSLQYGGMSMSSDVYLQLGIDDKMLLNQTTDDWRIFSKLGFGYSSIRKQYEVTLNGYVCLPLHDGNGIEFVISAKTFDKTLDNGEQVDKKMRIGIQNVVKYLINTYGGGYS